MADTLQLLDIVEVCHAESIALRLVPTIEYRWRSYCRKYSKIFHTPYEQVLEMSPEFVLSTLFEDQMEAVDIEEDLEELMDMIYTIEDPNYDSAKELEIREFVRRANEAERLRLKEGKPVPTPIKKTILTELPRQDPNLPTEGFVNLAYLSKQDSEG